VVRRVEVRLGYSAKRKGWDLRRFLWRHTKANGIDADTLAPQPLFDPTGLRPLVLAGAEQRQRIKDPVRQLLPKNPLTGDLGVADLAAPDRWADANALVKSACASAHRGDRQGAERTRCAARRCGRPTDRLTADLQGISPR
jgi:hypothetical protein